jgi:peptide-methionine (S)-S-oxide reductase
MGILQFKKAVTLVAALFFITACGQSKMQNRMTNSDSHDTISKPLHSSGKIDTVTFGAGCFWCVEAVFQRIEGVISVNSGYSGGSIKNPSYKEVCAGVTGHAEVCQVVYDTTVVSFDVLLQVFWKTHDPTTLNRQGNDIGTQYRSAIFYHNEEQRVKAESYKQQLNAIAAYPDPIVTEIKPFTVFYPAEDYHQNYYNLNSSQGYCQYVIQPKLEKMEKVFKDKLKK